VKGLTVLRGPHLHDSIKSKDLLDHFGGIDTNDLIKWWFGGWEKVRWKRGGEFYQSTFGVVPTKSRAVFLLCHLLLARGAVKQR